MNTLKNKPYFRKFGFFLLAIASVAIAQEDPCYKKCENEYIANVAKCTDQHCKDRMLDIRNECRHICQQR